MYDEERVVRILGWRKPTDIVNKMTAIEAGRGPIQTSATIAILTGSPHIQSRLLLRANSRLILRS